MFLNTGKYVKKQNTCKVQGYSLLFQWALHQAFRSEDDYRGSPRTLL